MIISGRTPVTTVGVNQYPWLNAAPEGAAPPVSTGETLIWT
jgi:hypothetical protein